MVKTYEEVMELVGKVAEVSAENTQSTAVVLARLEQQGVLLTGLSKSVTAVKDDVATLSNDMEQLKLAIKFKTLEEAESVYGKGSLVGISKIDQIIFYTRHGLQPELTLPSDKVDGHIVCWFHKNKTKLIYQRWNEERLKNNE